MIRLPALFRYILSLWLLLALVTTGGSTGFAQSGGDKMDAVLVVDVSHSMSQSDKNGVSLEAMKMFVDMTSAQGNKIGVVAYTDKIEREKALINVNSEQDKKDIKAFIDSLQKGPYTDIAVGVGEAVKILENGQDPAHAPIIVLLADGNNDLNKASKRTQEKSDEELNEAIQTAKDKGYPIYTIGLNADGKLNRNPLQQIAAQTGGRFFETSTADNLPQILSEIFANHSKVKVVPLQNFTSNGQFQEVPITIPNGSVLEANISITSGKAVELKLTDPSGKDVAIPSQDILLSRSRTYTMLKLIQPSQGDWKLQVKGAERDKIAVNLIFNYDVQLMLEPLAAKAFKKGDVISIKAALVTNGQQSVSPDLYKKMKAKLIVQESGSQQPSEIDLTNTGSGFEGSFTIPEAKQYELKVKAEDASFYRETKPVTVDASKGAGTGSGTNPPPITSPITEEPGSFPWTAVIVGAIGVLLVSAGAIYLFAAWKKANKGFTGQIAIEIVDEDTGEKSNPQYKKLNAFKGKVKLHQLLQLAPEFQETDKVLFFPGKNDTLLIENRSGCRVEKAGRVLDASKGREMKKNDRIKISLTSVNKSVYVDYIV
ncbi:VWA domain-containing protein [Brevibacillus ruminantium]|uniref:VWA domain-containing protein n=1 Tax=Brevibacillus ruminantium TaxID=2950604 RepID=A0ABY4WES3_9BACL|nr:vWA domain-containing protein [Brevibacillus ruminantium]USG65572.1 VWA domain-containing protein [Brevibacillus ruminantium]